MGDFTVFVKLMPNLKRINMYNGKPYAPSIELDTAVVGNLLQTLDIIGDSESLSESFETINIVKPKTDISGFIEQNQSLFQGKGWTLKKQTFNTINFTALYGSCDENLCVVRV